MNELMYVLHLITAGVLIIVIGILALTVADYDERRKKLMVHVKYEISKEDYDLAKEKGARVLISAEEQIGYGVYCPGVKEEDGKFYIYYDRGDSCD